MAEGSFRTRLASGFAAKLSGPVGSENSEAGRGMILSLIISVSMAAALASALIWLNIERTTLAYDVRKLQRVVAERLDEGARLSVERERLLSPHELGEKAEKMGLGPAKPGQIRRMDP